MAYLWGFNGLLQLPWSCSASHSVSVVTDSTVMTIPSAAAIFWRSCSPVMVATSRTSFWIRTSPISYYLKYSLL
ncbi:MULTISPECIES: hypothetical protein [Metallosphaera]|uniref:hypothetical protein n=1 Tax=Metallosphaera TaxID=41980 RepID=UPI001F05FFCB|nr:hypothetical protein [Metallosphaera sedula]MCH1771381.1 hypothetical protein [Metallosphaera sedula]MCP6729772.1 hypothetical protein [Metallosphaera sedula]